MKHNDQESQDGSSLFLLQKAKVDKLMRKSKFPSFSPVLRAMAMVTGTAKGHGKFQRLVRRLHQRRALRTLTKPFPQ